MPFEVRKARRAEKRERAEAEKEARAYLAEHEPIASWGDRLHLCQDGLVRFGPRFSKERPEVVPLDGVSAELGAPGEESRSRVQRNLESRRQVWLTVSGRYFRWQEPVPVPVAQLARDFAAAVNEHVAATRPGPPPKRRKKKR